MGTRLANSSGNTFSHYLIFKSISVKSRPKSDNCKCTDTNVSNTGHEELTAPGSHKDKGTDGVWAVYKRLCFCIAKVSCCGRHTLGLCVCVLFIHTQLRKPQLLVTTMSQGTASNWSDVAHKLNRQAFATPCWARWIQADGSSLRDHFQPVTKTTLCLHHLCPIVRCSASPNSLWPHPLPPIHPPMKVTTTAGSPWALMPRAEFNSDLQMRKLRRVEENVGRVSGAQGKTV